MRAAEILPLLVWLSPSFPVGAFAYSHGLESAVENGDIRDAATLRSWIFDLMEHGGIGMDLVLASCAARALSLGDGVQLGVVAELALSLSPSSERRLEATQQGRSFLDAVLAAWPSSILEEAFAPRAEIAYPIAFGASIAAHRLALRPSLAAYALQFAANLASAVVRLGIVGQTDGQRVVASLANGAQRVAAKTARAQLSDLGSAAFRSDIASLRHEIQYSRLFRS